MSGTHGNAALASYRDTVAELSEEGVPFGDIEDAINARAGLTDDQKAALWLYAFSLRDRSEQQRDAQAHVIAVQEAAGEAPAAGGARPREFDAKGFPVSQRNRSFFERVARLLNPR